ncbi:MAG: DUF2634 domain-containing protein [Lacrimispora sp.]
MMVKLTKDLKLEDPTFVSRTYKLSDNKIEGLVDDVEALKQAIYKALSTEQYEYPIYSFDYGIAWKELIGEERAYVRAEMKRMIQEALLQDSRIRRLTALTLHFP